MISGFLAYNAISGGLITVLFAVGPPFPREVGLLDNVFTVIAAGVSLAAAISLFGLRRVALPLCVSMLGLSVVALALQGIGSANTAPAAWRVAWGALWLGIDAAIVFYVSRLRREGRLH